MALGPLCTGINSISVSTKSKGTSSAESTYQTDVRWRRAAMRREGLRAESKDITPRSVKTREPFLWSKGLGVGNWQTKTFLSLGNHDGSFPRLELAQAGKCASSSPSKLNFEKNTFRYATCIVTHVVFMLQHQSECNETFRQSPLLQISKFWNFNLTGWFIFMLNSLVSVTDVFQMVIYKLWDTLFFHQQRNKSML